MSQDNICVICDGTKIFLGHTCSFCNGTGEWNQTGENYLKEHICQCIVWGRKFCPVCGKLCHHDSSSTPKQVIDSGYGGMSNTLSIVTGTSTTSEPVEEQMITA